jgi:hypothetical protein
MRSLSVTCANAWIDPVPPCAFSELAQIGGLAVHRSMRFSRAPISIVISPVVPMIPMMALKRSVSRSRRSAQSPAFPARDRSPASSPRFLP